MEEVRVRKLLRPVEADLHVPHCDRLAWPGVGTDLEVVTFRLVEFRPGLSAVRRGPEVVVLRAEVERRREDRAVVAPHVGAREIRDLERVHSAARDGGADPVLVARYVGRAGLEEAAVAAEEDWLERRIHTQIAHVGVDAGRGDIAGPVPFGQSPELFGRRPCHLSPIPTVTGPDLDGPRPELAGLRLRGDSEKRAARAALVHRHQRLRVGIELVEPDRAEPLLLGVGPVILPENESPRRVGRAIHLVDAVREEVIEIVGDHVSPGAAAVVAAVERAVRECENLPLRKCEDGLHHGGRKRLREALMGPSGAVVRADRHPEIRSDVPKTFLVGRPRNPVRARACDLRRGRHHSGRRPGPAPTAVAANVDASAIGHLVVAKHRRDHRCPVGAKLDVPDHDRREREDTEPGLPAADRSPQSAELHRHENAVAVPRADRDRLHAACVEVVSGEVGEGRRDRWRILDQVHAFAARDDHQRQQTTCGKGGIARHRPSLLGIEADFDADPRQYVADDVPLLPFFHPPANRVRSGLERTQRYRREAGEVGQKRDNLSVLGSGSSEGSSRK